MIHRNCPLGIKISNHEKDNTLTCPCCCHRRPDRPDSTFRWSRKQLDLRRKRKRLCSDGQWRFHRKWIHTVHSRRERSPRSNSSWEWATLRWRRKQLEDFYKLLKGPGLLLGPFLLNELMILQGHSLCEFLQ